MEFQVSLVFVLAFMAARTKDQRQKDQRHLKFLSVQQVFKFQEANAVQSFEV